MEQSTAKTVLLFSGGRDSTLAALRLAKESTSLTLVTATSDHLVGIDAVRIRLRELAAVLPAQTPWIRVRQPRTAHVEAFTAPTCLPCHAAYTAVGVAIARETQSQAIAFGYAGYQSTWPEQTPYAVRTLREVVEGLGYELRLPVYDVQLKEAAVAELEGHLVSSKALEQKCTQQQFNVTLAEDTLHAEIDLWAKSTRATIEETSQRSCTVLERHRLGDLR